MSNLFEYNKSTGVMRTVGNKHYKGEVRLTPTEMKIGEILFDYKWHNVEEIDKKLGLTAERRRVYISKLKKKIRRYIEIKAERGVRYKCVKTKKRQAKQ